MNRFARHENPALVALTLLALAASGIDPFDRLTWFLETFPVMLGLPLLIATHRRFPLTPLVCRLLFGHALILMLGGITRMRAYRQGSGCRMRSIWRATTTTGWGIWHRASCQPCLRAKFCCVAHRCARAAGCSS